jgi:uncharacterized protein (TIGR02271 family)
MDRDNRSTHDPATGSTTSREVSKGVGGVAGVAAGAAIGSLAGPVGTVIGGIAGAVGGWWAGKEVADAATSFTDVNDTEYRTHFTGLPKGSRGRLTSYDQARPAYQLGYLASRNPDYRGRSFDQIEGDLRRGWTPDVEKQAGYSWNEARNAVAEGFTRGGTSGDEQRITLAEEELVVSKRPMKAGEVGVKKTVETEHVSKSVPLMHEEVEVERHPVAADSRRDDVEVREQNIRIPLSAEEAVVNKRAVAKEEVVVRKRAVEETRNVEGDVRKEKIDIKKSGRARGTDTDRETDRDTDMPAR